MTSREVANFLASKTPWGPVGTASANLPEARGRMIRKGLCEESQPLEGTETQGSHEPQRGLTPARQATDFRRDEDPEAGLRPTARG